MSASALRHSVEPELGEFDAWRDFLRGPRAEPAHGSTLEMLDLFSGVGGLALGFRRAAAAHGIAARSRAAVDTDAGALAVYGANLGTPHRLEASVRSLVDFQVRGVGAEARFLYPPELIGTAAGALGGGVNVVLAGPPCQGNSSLNNKTRGDDPRNKLYLTVPAVAVATRATTVIIENVPGVARSKGNVVDTAVTLLQAAGFSTTMGQLSADKLGWPQTRKRFFVVATRERDPIPFTEIKSLLGRDAAPMSWAIDDLIDGLRDDPMYAVAELSAENAERISWLFENDQYETPDHLRPDCHKGGTTYGAVYGRMKWDQPAPTLTTGFLTPGRGRFIHPLRERTLTPREAARIQGFPDWFDFDVDKARPVARKDLAKWIGNAVPSILGYAAGISALGRTD